jgi:tetratricopeptide (TPR) repeat protein
LSRHPTPEELRGLLCDSLAPARYRAVVSHLLGGCKRCRRDLAAWLPPRFGGAAAGPVLSPEEDAAYDAAIERAFAAVRRHDRHARRASESAREVLAALAQGPADAVEITGLGGLEALLERSQAVRYDDPAQMVVLAHRAVAVAAGLRVERYGERPVADFRCRAATELANAYRVADRLDDAEGALAEAVGFYGAGTHDSLLEARVFDVRASVLGDRRQFEQADELLERVGRIYRRHGESHLTGRALVSRGMYAGYAGDSERAIGLIFRGLDLVDGERDPALVFAGVHNLAHLLVECGRFAEARTLLWRNLQRWEGAVGRVNALKLRWVEARCNVGLGDLDLAEQTLSEVRRGFAEGGLHYKAALATLDLAALALRRKRADEARSLVIEASRVFAALHVQREVLATMLLLEKVCELRAASAALLELAARLMARAEDDPTLTVQTWFV